MIKQLYLFSIKVFLMQLIVFFMFGCTFKEEIKFENINKKLYINFNHTYIYDGIEKICQKEVIDNSFKCKKNKIRTIHANEIVGVLNDTYLTHMTQIILDDNTIGWIYNSNVDIMKYSNDFYDDNFNSLEINLKEKMNKTIFEDFKLVNIIRSEKTNSLETDSIKLYVIFYLDEDEDKYFKKHLYEEKIKNYFKIKLSKNQSKRIVINIFGKKDNYKESIIIY